MRVTIRGREYEVRSDFDVTRERDVVTEAGARLVLARQFGRASYRRERRQFNSLIAGVLSRMLDAPRCVFEGGVRPEDEETVAGLLATLAPTLVEGNR